MHNHRGSRVLKHTEVSSACRVRERCKRARALLDGGLRRRTRDRNRKIRIYAHWGGPWGCAPQGPPRGATWARALLDGGLRRRTRDRNRKIRTYAHRAGPGAVHLRARPEVKKGHELLNGGLRRRTCDQNRKMPFRRVRTGVAPGIPHNAHGPLRCSI